MSGPRTTAEVAARLTPEEWTARCQLAETEARILERVLARVHGGESRSSALRAELPERPVSSTLRRLRRFEEGGRDALLNRRLPVRKERKMNDEARGALRALAVAHPGLGSEALAAKLSELLGISVRPTAVQGALRDLGLARPRGRPPGRARPQQASGADEVEEVTPLGLAGAELLEAVDEEIGAVRTLTAAISAHLDRLPAAEGPVVDDTAHRDERGRFLAEYNTAARRTEPELGERFDSVEKRRAQKNLPAMRVAKESDATLARKNLGLVLLPTVVRGPRWSALAHWRGEQLGELIGFPYQASTLDKYLRELELSGAAATCREATTSFWLGQEGPVADPQTGAVILYVDAKTKPLWTHHWTKSTKVSQTGRVMPAVSTVTLHSGAGTPLIFRSWSGQVSLPSKVRRFLDTYEQHAGDGTARRLVVMDRESHAVWLFKELAGDGRHYIVPLRKSVVGPSARFEDVGSWGPYSDSQDEVCGAHLWLNDSRKGEKPLRVRVVGRRRHRTGKVAWYATNAPAEEFSSSDVIRLYFERWPAQEHVYRDGSGLVGLDVHHGYGKKKIQDVAVMDKLDKLQGRERRVAVDKARHESRLAPLGEQLSDWQGVISDLEPELTANGAALAAGLQPGAEAGADLAGVFETYQTYGRWLDEARRESGILGQEIDSATQAIAECDAKELRLADERRRLERRREIFTVDVELDEVLTAFKLTFMNLCCVLMKQYLGKWMELETLIDAVLTLPGERVVTPTTETVRIFRPRRDART
ncbi:MAG: hypothetical protein GY719_04120, partial [bacterium]|nr:hypothetical protein [bacterium]